jgi:hypothetical protein
MRKKNKPLPCLPKEANDLKLTLRVTYCSLFCNKLNSLNLYWMSILALRDSLTWQFLTRDFLLISSLKLTLASPSPSLRFSLKRRRSLTHSRRSILSFVLMYRNIKSNSCWFALKPLKKLPFARWRMSKKRVVLMYRNIKTTCFLKASFALKQMGGNEPC